MSKYLTRSESRDVDRIAIEELGFSGLVLMENAGRGAVDTLQQRRIVHREKPIVLICGRGNNGGDGFVMARHLVLRDYRPEILLLADPETLTGDAKTNFDILARCDGKIEVLSPWTPESRSRFENRLRESEIWIDALLGTGAVGPPREPFAEAIRIVDRLKEQDRKGSGVKVVALDIPSGLDADTGRPNEPTIKADLTLTFFSEKSGFSNPDAAAFLGDVVVQDIGVPRTSMF